MSKSLLFSCIDCPTRPEGPFSDVPEEILASFSKSRVTNIYKKGQTIFYEGNHPYGVYCLNSGKVKLYKSTSDGKEYIVSLFKTGDILGYKSFFDNNVYSATAEVIEDSMICFLDKTKFFDLLKKHPPFSLKLLEMMAKEIHCAHSNETALAYKSANERIVELLLTLNKAFGIKQDDGSYKIDVALSREDMANMLGSTTETTVRLITWLKEKNIIEVKKKFIFIKDLSSLIDMIPEF